MQRYSINQIPSSLQGMWQRSIERNIGLNELQLRNNNSNKFIIPFSRLSLTERLPKASLPRQWEAFPDQNIKNTTNPLQFDKNLKKYFLDDLSEVVKGNTRVIN